VAVSRRKIIISGGGIAGLTAALCLAKNKNRVEVHERAITFDKLGAGIQISPNALHVFDSLGLGKEIRSASDAPNSIVMMNAKSGKQLASIPLGIAFEDKYEAPYLVIHRSDLQDILLSACKNHPEITINMGCEIVDAVSHPNGITAMVKKEYDISEVIADILVAADGIHSNIRTNSLDLPEANYSGKIAWRALIPAQMIDNNTALNNTMAWLGAKAHVVTYPVRKKTFLNVIAVTQEKTANDFAEIFGSVLQKKFFDWDDEIADLFLKANEWTGWPLYEMALPNKMAHGNIASIGDASHAMLPFAAQGAAQAIEDAHVLAYGLSAEKDIETALEKFEKARLPRVREIMKTANRNGRIYHLSGIMAASRNFVLGTLSGEKLLQQQDWIYRWKP